MDVSPPAPPNGDQNGNVGTVTYKLDTDGIDGYIVRLLAPPAVDTTRHLFARVFDNSDTAELKVDSLTVQVIRFRP